MKIAELSTRQKEVWKLLSEGHQNKNIAHLLSISEHTVKIHVSHIYMKLKVNNRTQAAIQYLNLNLGEVK